MPISNARRIARIMNRMAREDLEAASADRLDFKPDGTNTCVQFTGDDVYVADTISIGKTLNDDASVTVRGGTQSLAINTKTPTGVDIYSVIRTTDSTDPEGALIYCQSYEVLDQCDDGTNSPSFAGAFQVENQGNVFAWASIMAGRCRYDDSGTTNAYRAGDSSVSAYSATGATGGHGASFYRGFTAIAGRETLNTDDVFQVYSGNDASGAGGQYTIEFDAIGNGYFDGVSDAGAADYAEYFEWEDGNLDNEDRRGLSVVLTNGRFIRPATADDAENDFLGIVSVEPALVGDSAYFAWKGKWKRDKFGAKVFEDYQVACWGEYDPSQTGWQFTAEVGTPAADKAPADATIVTKQRPVLSEGFDPAVNYMPRQDRPEWQPIGLLGKVPLLKGQPTSPRWRKLFDLNDEVEMWLVR